MTRDRSLGLIERLVADLAPVEPVPPLWLAVMGPLAAGAAVALIVSGTAGLRPGVWLDVGREAGFTGVLLGLVAIGVAGCSAGLASAIPGRGRATACAVAIAGAGVGIAIGSAALLAPWQRTTWSLLAGDTECVAWGLVFSVAPVAVGFAMTRRTWAPRPALTASLTLLGTTSLGSLLVQLCCPVLDGRHLLVGHCAGPLLMAAVGGVALASWMQRWAR